LEHSQGCFYKAEWHSGDEHFENRELIAVPHTACDVTCDSEGKVNGLGEVSITEDERFMYFVYKKKILTGERVKTECPWDTINACDDTGASHSCQRSTYDIGVGVARNATKVSCWASECP